MLVAALRSHRYLISEVARLLHEEWGNLPAWSDRQLIERRLLNSSGEAQFPYALVAITDDGQFAGTASIKLRELAGHPDKEHWLGEVFVRKDMRGRELGTLLVGECSRYAFGAGVEALYLYTPDQQGLYGRLGWQHCGEEVVDGELVTIMVRSIDKHGVHQGT